MWQSKMLSGSTVTWELRRSQLANWHLALRLAFRNESEKPASAANGLILRNSERSLIHPSPMASVIEPESAGFDKCTQRRGVTPLVLLLNRSGNISARSLTVIVRSNSEWIAATPFVLWEPTIARFAIRTLRWGVSSTRLTR